MVEVKIFTDEEKVRRIVKEELSYLIPEYELLTESNLSKEEIKLCEKADLEYNNGETSSFEEVYDLVLND